MRVGIAADHGGVTLKGQVAKMIQSATSARGTGRANLGVVTSVRGSVVDVRFDESLPPIYSLLRAGKDARVAIEVLMHLDGRHVRGIALSPTQDVRVGDLLWVVEELSATVQSVAGGVVTFSTPFVTSLGASFAGTINTNVAAFGPGFGYVGRTSQASAVTVVAGTPPTGIAVTPASADWDAGEVTEIGSIAAEIETGRLPRLISSS